MAHFSFYRKHRFMKPIKVIKSSEIDSLESKKDLSNLGRPSKLVKSM